MTMLPTAPALPAANPAPARADSAPAAQAGSKDPGKSFGDLLPGKGTEAPTAKPASAGQAEPDKTKAPAAEEPHTPSDPAPDAMTVATCLALMQPVPVTPAAPPVATAPTLDPTAAKPIVEGAADAPPSAVPPAIPGAAMGALPTPAQTTPQPKEAPVAVTPQPTAPDPVSIPATADAAKIAASAAVQAGALPVTPGVPSKKPVEAPALKASPEAVAAKTKELSELENEESGTDSAKSPMIMVSASTQIKTSQTEAKPGFAEVSLARPTAATTKSASLAVHAETSPNAQSSLPGNDQVFPAAATNLISSGSAPLSESAPATPATAAAAATVLHELHEAADRLRSTGPERVELQVRLHTGEEVTIKLQLRDGQVDAVVRTESTQLRHALEENWSRQSSAGPERANRVSTPIFETSGTRSGSQDFFSRQQQGRQQQAPGQEASADATPWPRAGKGAAPARPVPAGTAAASVQRYA